MDRRIRVPKDKEEILGRLSRSDDNPLGPFRLKADVIMFAAVYGLRRGVRRELSEAGEPIRFEVFERQGYEPVVNLIALAVAEDPTALADSDAAIDLRSTLLEEYANGGLEILQQELHGLEDPLGRLLLLIARERRPEETEGAEDFDLGRFLRG